MSGESVSRSIARLAEQPPPIAFEVGGVAFHAITPAESLHVGNLSADPPQLTETEARAASEQVAEAGRSEADARAISEELLGAFMALMPDAAVAVDAAGRLVSVNEQAEELFGY